MVLRIVFALWLACLAAMAQEGRATVVSFGDSLTAPRKGVVTYSEVLARELNVEVINKGVGGNSSEQARARFAGDVLALHPNLVIIQLGTNDAAVDVWKNPPATEPRVAVAQYRRNIQFFVEELLKANSKVILMTPNRMSWTPKLVGLYGRAPYDAASDDGFNVLLDLYSDIVRGIAVREKVPLVDAAAIVPKEDLLDGMHPSSEGHRSVANALLPVIRKMMRLP